MSLSGGGPSAGDTRKRLRSGADVLGDSEAKRKVEELTLLMEQDRSRQELERVNLTGQVWRPCAVGLELMTLRCRQLHVVHLQASDLPRLFVLCRLTASPLTYVKT